MIISKYIEIDMGHRVPNHKSKCRNLHGHRYKIEVGVNDKVVDKKGSSDEGMVIDFSDLKAVMMQELDEKFDHGFVISSDDDLLSDFQHYRDGLGMKIIEVDFIPTAENLAKYWFELMEPKLAERGVKLFYVTIWETPSSTAQYRLLDKETSDA